MSRQTLREIFEELNALNIVPEFSAVEQVTATHGLSSEQLHEEARPSLLDKFRSSLTFFEGPLGRGIYFFKGGDEPAQQSAADFVKLYQNRSCRLLLTANLRFAKFFEVLKNGEFLSHARAVIIEERKNKPDGGERGITDDLVIRALLKHADWFQGADGVQKVLKLGNPSCEAILSRNADCVMEVTRELSV